MEKFHFKTLVVAGGKYTAKDFHYSKKKNNILAENINIALIAKTNIHPSYLKKL